MIFDPIDKALSELKDRAKNAATVEDFQRLDTLTRELIGDALQEVSELLFNEQDAAQQKEDAAADVAIGEERQKVADQIKADIEREQKKQEESLAQQQGQANLLVDLDKLPGVGPATAKRMMEGHEGLAPITSLEQLAKMSVAEVSTYPGITDDEAKEIIKTAATLG